MTAATRRPETETARAARLDAMRAYYDRLRHQAAVTRDEPADPGDLTPADRAELGSRLGHPA